MRVLGLGRRYAMGGCHRSRVIGLNRVPYGPAVLLCLLLAGLPFAAEATTDRIVLNTGVSEPYTGKAGNKGFLDRIVERLFQRLGKKAEIAVFPSAERALINANKGIEDGDVLRVRGLEKYYPNLIRVPEKLIDNNFVAYSVDLPIKAVTWDSLKPYVVGYIIGWKIFEQNTRQVKETTRVSDRDQLFALLGNRRADVVLYEQWQGLWTARQAGIKVRILNPPLASLEMFMYMHKKHKDLIPQVAKTLAAMKADGTYRKIFDATLAPLLKK